MEGTLDLQGCAEALEENKSAGMDDATWKLPSPTNITRGRAAINNVSMQKQGERNHLFSMWPQRA